MSSDEQLEKLKEVLNTHMGWPALYMFKFIIPTDNRKIALIESKFSEAAQISQYQSSGGKYISITIREIMLNADSVIDKYKEMKGIEGLIAL
jgi:uncharacterized protein